MDVKSVRKCWNPACSKPRYDSVGYKYCLECSANRPYLPKGRCFKCGGPKPKGIGRRYCDDCKALQDWAYAQRRAYHPPRPCKKCGERTIKGRSWKYCEKCRTAKPVCQRCHERPIRADKARLCEVCKAESLLKKAVYSRLKQREYRADPVKRAKMKAKARKYEVKRRQSKAVRAKRAETARIAYRLRNHSKPVSKEKYLKGMGRYALRKQLPAEPLVPFMKQWLEEHPVQAKGYTVPSVYELGRLAGVNDKKLRWILDGRTTSICESDADKVCIAMDTSLDWVYNREISGDGDLCA